MGWEDDISVVTPKEFHDSCAKEKYDDLKESMIKEFGLQLGTFLANRIAKAIRKTKDLCIDNFRVARTWNPVEMAQYNKAREQGCCGFWDEEVVFTHKVLGVPVWKEKFIFGFNYGH